MQRKIWSSIYKRVISGDKRFPTQSVLLVMSVLWIRISNRFVLWRKARFLSSSLIINKVFSSHPQVSPLKPHPALHAGIKILPLFLMTQLREHFQVGLYDLRLIPWPVGIPNC